MDNWSMSEGKKQSKNVVCGCQYFQENRSNNKKRRVQLCGNKGETKKKCVRLIADAALKKGEHEYEPVIPMDVHKTPPPLVRITPDKEHYTVNNEAPAETKADKNHLHVPETNEYDDDNNLDSDDANSEEITAEELQQRLEEKYFRSRSPAASSTTTDATKHEYEFPRTRSVSPALTDDATSSCKSADTSSSLPHKMQQQAEKLRRKFKNFKEQISKEYADCSPRAKRKASNDGELGPVPAGAEMTAATPPTAVKKVKPKSQLRPKKNKFNFRRHAAKLSTDHSKLPSEPDLHGWDKQGQSSEQSALRQFSFRSLRSFRRSPSGGGGGGSSSSNSSLKERERKRSLSSESGTGMSKKRFDFHFATYPRIFGKRCKKSAAEVEETKAEDEEVADKSSVCSKAKSAPGTPMPRRGPISQRWMAKFMAVEHEKQPPTDQGKCKPKKNRKEGGGAAGKPVSSDPVVRESIFISLHGDSQVIASETAAPKPTAATKRPNSPPGCIPPTPPDTTPPTKMRIDNKNFIFISLHEERFPEKLRKVEPDPSLNLTEEELEIERELKKAQTARKFHHMLRKLETDRKLKTRRTTDKDDKPEPVIITEITADDEADVFRNADSATENSVETPEDEEVARKSSSEYVPPEKLVFEQTIADEQKTPLAPTSAPQENETLFKSLSKIDFSKKIVWDKLKFGKKPAARETFDENFDVNIEPEQAAKMERKSALRSVSPIPAASLRMNGHEIHVDTNCESEVIPGDATAPFATVPRRMPRKRTKIADSEKELSKESLSAFEDSAFKDAVLLDVQKSYTKTYIKASLDEIPLYTEPELEPEHVAKQFKEYEKALRKNTSYSGGSGGCFFASKNNFYSAQNTLARLETPIPPSRLNRKGTVIRDKGEKSAAMPTEESSKENVYDFEVEVEAEAKANHSYNTFPLIRPDKPRRKLRKRRTYSNSTNNTENGDAKNINELEDDAINQKIINSKQLSVSFLPLTSDLVGEPITEYNLRETSSMIHLNLNDPPLPPKRRKGPMREEHTQKYNTMPSPRYVSKMSLSPCQAYHTDLNIDGEIDYADDVNSTVPDSDSPPKRPSRKRSTGPSTVDEDRTSRGIDSISSEKSSKNDLAVFCDEDSNKDIHGYAVIGTPAAPRASHTQSEGRNSQATIRRKSRRFSDFFTFPRIRAPINYVPASAQTLDRRRLPSPCRPPRRPRPDRELTYTNDEADQQQTRMMTKTTAATNEQIDFDGEEELNFNLATVEDECCGETHAEDAKNLQTDDIVEKMKSRPLPPPPRPTRKPNKDIGGGDKNEHYSQSIKNKCTSSRTNELDRTTGVVEEKIINTTAAAAAAKAESTQRSETESKNWLTNECSNSSTRFEGHSVFASEITETESQPGDVSQFQPTRQEISPSKPKNLIDICQSVRIRVTENDSSNDEKKLNDQTWLNNASHTPRTKSEENLQQGRSRVANRSSVAPSDQSESRRNSPAGDTRNSSEDKSIRQGEDSLPEISGTKLEISELSVANGNVGEIESSRLPTLSLDIDSSLIQTSSIRGDGGHLALNCVEFAPIPDSPRLAGQEAVRLAPKLSVNRDATPSSDDAPSAGGAQHSAKQRPRISSMITEVGSDEEPNSKVTKVVRPNRRRQSLRRSEPSCSSSSADGQGDRPTLAELMGQILQICHSSVGQAIHSLLEQIIPEDREKRNEVQAAIWVITIIVAGCLMLGLQSNEKIVHHHHWDFHFPPPH